MLSLNASGTVLCVSDSPVTPNTPNAGSPLHFDQVFIKTWDCVLQAQGSDVDFESLCPWLPLWRWRQWCHMAMSRESRFFHWLPVWHAVSYWMLCFLYLWKDTYKHHLFVYLNPFVYKMQVRVAPAPPLRLSCFWEEYAYKVLGRDFVHFKCFTYISYNYLDWVQTEKSLYQELQFPFGAKYSALVP